MEHRSLFHIEVVDGAVKVTPSEELVSMPKDRQISALQDQLRMYQDELKNIDNQTDRDECETELMIVILKNLIKRFMEPHWELMKS